MNLTTAPLSLDYAIATAVFSGISAVFAALSCFACADPYLKDYLAIATVGFGVLFGLSLASAMAIGHSHIRKVLAAKS